MPEIKKKQILILLFCLLLFLCAVPAVSYAAQQQSSIPKPMGEIEVADGTTVEMLKSSFVGNMPGATFRVYKSDGSIRPDGYLETGDLAVAFDSHGEVLDCEKVIVKSSASSSSPTVSSAVSSAVSSETGSSAPQSSETPISSAASAESISSFSSVSSAASSSDTQKSVYVFTHSTTVDEVRYPADDSTKSGKYRIVVSTSSGIRRGNGYVCTGDEIHVFNDSGEAIDTMTAVILGDLTHCGKVSDSGCAMLYNYLTNQRSMDSEALAAADINQDGVVDTADLLCMKKELMSNS